MQKLFVYFGYERTESTWESRKPAGQPSIPFFFFAFFVRRRVHSLTNMVTVEIMKSIHWDATRTLPFQFVATHLSHHLIIVLVISYR